MSACGTDDSGSEFENESEDLIEEVLSARTTEIEEQPDELETEPEIVLENQAFRIYEPAPNSEVGNEFTVRVQARVFEGNVRYEFEDGHFILDEGFVTASEGTPGWGDFEITIQFDELSNEDGMVILFEESAKDGERLHELIIPVKHYK